MKNTSIHILKFLIWCAEHDCDPGFANSSDSYATKLFNYIQDWELRGVIREPKGFSTSFAGMVAEMRGSSWQQVVDTQLGLDN